MVIVLHAIIISVDHHCFPHRHQAKALVYIAIVRLEPIACSVIVYRVLVYRATVCVALPIVRY